MFGEVHRSDASLWKQGIGYSLLRSSNSLHISICILKTTSTSNTIKDDIREISKESNIYTKIKEFPRTPSGLSQSYLFILFFFHVILVFLLILIAHIYISPSHTNQFLPGANPARPRIPGGTGISVNPSEQLFTELGYPRHVIPKYAFSKFVRHQF
jgi:hypothetical protein